MLTELPPLGLYIHLPWCERKCPYCDFNSHEAQVIPEQAYIQALLQDLDGELARAQGRQLSSLFIGGGTPSLFSAAAIATLMAGISARLPLAKHFEATMEANPGSAEADKFAGFRAAGINRLSLGVQSFNDAQLQALGRVHSAAQAHAAIAMAGRAGFDNLNIDLMHGLPGQQSERGLDDIRSALSYQPTHLSWYQLTIEPNTLFHKRPPTLPVEDTLAAIQEGGEDILVAAGLSAYEVSAWSLPGRECRHNLNYWSFGDYLAIGAGAHGKITWPDGRIERYAKRKQPKEYMQAQAGAFTGSQRWLSAEDLPGEYMMNALRLAEGTELQAFTQRTGLSLETIEAPLAALSQRGLIEIVDGKLRCSAVGWRFLDTVVAEFF
ncbi:radical SAM family heme chaperone HemW [Parahaliea sp. F7430]|uniref:Heme chaperone HemW n=1 Tax=Sediminihaliea albiluteola TaxID=2758564 RepID=A0A7W2TX63_9GAMM|nr:radical SAM family heme chaperone HemW [Sediminihaliea albiluteola]MBA6413567.1 radical SAM family heme chaperone HemW [Sediminihaliea albiluteola]